MIANIRCKKKVNIYIKIQEILSNHNIFIIKIILILMASTIIMMAIVILQELLIVITIKEKIANKNIHII